MNYTTLQSDLAAYIDRTDLTSRIVEFIELAEKRLMHDLKFRGTEKSANIFLTSGTTTVTPPTRFRSVILLQRFLNRQIIKRRTLSFLNRYTSDLATSTGAPEYYTVFENVIHIAPTADQTYELELSYFEELEALSGSNTTNYFTDNTPQLLLYASLLEAAPYLHTDERIPVWQERYNGFISSIQQDQRFYDYDEAVL